MQRLRSASALVVALCVPRAAEGTLWIHSRCAGQTCDDKPATPIIDWNGERCVCRAHPCWSDMGIAHGCSSPENPYLVFGYHANDSLACGCQAFPHIGSVYLQQYLCPGENCKNPKAPVLDFDEEKGRCICRSNPCLHDDGLEHQCGDVRFPILSYSLNAKGKLQCGCIKKFNPEEYKREL